MKTTKPKKPVSKYVLLTIAILIVGLGYFMGSVSQISLEEDERLSVMDSTEFKNELQTMIFELRLEHPDIVYAQAQLESAGWTSPVFRENHNMFGMKAPWSRITTCIGVNKGHARYISWRYSLLDYAIWQIVNGRGLTDEEYFDRLRSVYAEDEEYIVKIKEIIRKNN